ncbi:MAG: protein kinase domain-containing protein [Candidatus Brocadiia bacterium]
MPTKDDLLFVRAAVEAGLLERAQGDEVLGALDRVEQLGASSSAQEIALNRGYLTGEQADRVLAGSGLQAPTPTRRSGRVGNYEILERLGVGGMGVVYKARQVTMDRLVALKVLPPRVARDRSFVQRFLREARSAARLNHPNIVQGIDVGEADGLYYFAMELVDGESLRARIGRLGRVSQGEALGIARQIALALEHANTHHMIHRDIKPDNILLTRAGVAKLADLGLAKRATDASVTQLTTPIGTPLYMSPEQARGEPSIDTRSDIYSLGATLYHAVVGSPPFTAETTTAILTQHLFEKPPWPRDAAPELTEGFCHVLMRMLAKKPSARYQTPTELLQDVNRLINGRAPLRARPRAASTSTRRRRVRRRKRSPLVPIFATTSIFVLTAGAWLLYSTLAGATERPRGSRRSEPQPRHVVESPDSPGSPSAEPSQPDPAAKARAELDQVRAWDQSGESEAQTLERYYRAIAQRYPGTAAAGKAAEAARRLHRECEAAARRPLEKAREEAERLAEAHRYADAVRVLDELAAEHGQFMQAAAEARGSILSRAARHERELRSEARRRLEGGDFAGAIEAYRQIIGFGVPQFSARARREIEQAEKRWAAARQKARAEAEKAHLAIRLDVAALLADRRYAEARARLEAALERPDLEPVAEELEAELADVAALHRLWDAAEQGARGLERGEPFSVGGIRGTFQRFADGLIAIRASGLEVKKPLRELRTREVLRLAAEQLPPEEPATAIARGLFLLAEGKPQAAREAFEQAGGDAQRYLGLVERRAADAREAEAQAAFARLARLAREDQWAEARQALSRYREKHADTVSFVRHRHEVERLALQVRLATLDAADLFHGACRLLDPPRKVELSYDFSDPAQLADWHLRGRQWALGERCLRLESAGALLRAPSTGDVQASLQLADASGPPGPWGLSLAEASGAPPLVLVSLPERIGEDVVLREGRREVARGPVGFGVGDFRQVAFARRGRRAGLAVGGKEVLAWSDEGGPAAPPLRFGVGARGERAIRVRAVRVVAELPESWVAEELERLRLRLRAKARLAQAPWAAGFGEDTLGPWTAEHGAWEVAEGTASVEFGGNIVLREPWPDHVEWRLEVQPRRDDSVVRLRFRLAPGGEGYALILGGEAEHGALRLQGKGGGRAGEALARFAERVDWTAGRWYDLRLVAVGSELRAELDGGLLCLVRDDRRHGGTLSLDVLQGGAAIRELRLRGAE